MKRVKLEIAYDGTRYCGWQIQPNGKTVEEVMNVTLTKLFNEDIQVIGASRTDSGVHAGGNVAVFDTQTRMPAEKVSFALNQRLPEDIIIQSSIEVPGDFHPRRCKSKKTYEYRILNSRFDRPTERLYSHFIYTPINLEAMQEGAKYLLGKHDFTSFCTPGSKILDKTRTILSITIAKNVDIIDIKIIGDGFLYNMVRIIVGTLIKIGLGHYPPEYINIILNAKDRGMAGPTAPAKGLMLKKIEFDD